MDVVGSLQQHWLALGVLLPLCIGAVLSWRLGAYVASFASATMVCDAVFLVWGF
jgi:hypothetical protein